MTFGEYLPRLLAANGFDIIFGIPGVHTVEMYRGLKSSPLQHITPRHEQGAGFMADGYARMTGRVATCFVITGPGITNILTAMGQAYADSIPMLVISSTLARPHIRKQQGRLHELKDQRLLSEGVTVYSHTLTECEEFFDVLTKAMRIFYRRRPSPVHIEIPLDVLNLPADHLPIKKIPLTEPALTREAEAGWEEAMKLWKKSRNPILIMGGGMLSARNQAIPLAEFLDAPTVVTINAKGLLPPRHSLHVGCLLPQEEVLKTVRDADVVMAVGTELGETETLLFGKDFKMTGKLIRWDIDPDQLSINADPQVAIAADIRNLSQLLQERKEKFQKQGALKTVQLRKKAWASISQPYREYGKLLTAIAQVWPGAVIVGDSTQPVYGGNLTYDPPAPGQWFNASTGYGTLGYALPASIGALVGAMRGKSGKYSQLDCPVICLIGDGGLQFTLPELATAVELCLPLPILLWNNQGYGEIKRYMVDRAIPLVGVDIYTPDFQTLARGFGAEAVKIETNQVVEEIGKALKRNFPTLIEVNEK